jgi:hypothetical protein
MKKSSKRNTLNTEERLQNAHLGIAKVLDESQLSFVEMMGVLELSKIGVTRAMEAREQELLCDGDCHNMQEHNQHAQTKVTDFDRSYFG